MSTTSSSALAPDTFMTSGAVAQAVRAAGIPLADSTLDYWATHGEGPPFRKLLGRRIYARSAVEGWIRQHLAIDAA